MASSADSNAIDMPLPVIGGIIVSTVLSLVVVPSFYLIMDDLSRLLTWIFSRMIGPKESEPAEVPSYELAERLDGLETAQANMTSLLAAEQGSLRDRVAALEPQSQKPRKGDLAAAE